MIRVFGLIFLVAILATPAWGQCVQTNGFHPSYFNLVNVHIASGTPSNVAQGIQQGLDKWNDASCNVGYDDFPYFNISGSSPKLTFDYATGLGPLMESGSTSCARITYLSNGAASVTFYSHIKLAADPNNTYPCPDDEAGLSFMAAHEAGHYLGLADSTCSGYIMSALNGSFGGGQITWSYPASKPQNAECEKADEITTTVDEEENECTEGENICSGWGNDSPLVLDLDGNGFHFSSVIDKVAFDIDDDGYKELISWTGVGEGDAFLALDRNANGTIDSGAELFGDATPLMNGGRATDGFSALREFDTNLDGSIDRSDAVFALLLLWLDLDHDGVSTAGELLSLDQAGVLSIELYAIVSERRDPHGNQLRYSGRFWMRGPAGSRVPRQVTDVFFVRD
jgi:hypothetical protein